MRPIILCFALFVGSAQAAELEYSLMTHHWLSRGLNEQNHLVGFHHNGFEVATFINSFGDRSFSAGYRLVSDGGLSVSVGVIDGYRENSKFFPVRFGETVAYVSINYTVNVTDHVGVRFRQMGEVFLMSGVVEF